MLAVTVQACTAPLSVQGQVEAAEQPREIILATTTSTYDTGLLDTLIPVFESESDYIVKIVAVGTGKALQMGAQGDADLLLVHAPEAELEFMASGWGQDRALIMHNDFVIVGPVDDPAGVQGKRSPVEAFRRIHATRAPFITRGDDSGTHKKELAYWEAAAIEPAGDWYIDTGQGMGATLRVASELDAYTLTDRSTYTTLAKILSLAVLVEGDPSMINFYHGMTVNPERWPAVNGAGAKALLDFFLSAEGQQIIDNFGLETYGAPLFISDAGKDAEYGLK